MYVASEALAWFDPALLAAENSMDSEKDEETCVAKRLVSTAVRRRLETNTLTSCALNSRTVHADCAALFGNAKSGEAIGSRVDVPVCPIDAKAEPFAHIAIAGGTYAIVPATYPPSLCIFDKVNAVLVSRVPLTHNSTESHTNGYDKDDNVAAIFLDPRGRFCILRWRSGRAEYVYIPLRPQCAAADGPRRNTQCDGECAENVRESALAPRRFPLRFSAELTGLREPFVIASVAWDTANVRDTSSGDILLGSTRGGLLVTCRLEHTGAVGARRLFQFPAPLRSRPISSLSHTAIASNSTAAPSLHRRIVFVVQRHRLFVFAGLWAAEAGLSSAFASSAFVRQAGEARSAVALPPAESHVHTEVTVLNPREVCTVSCAGRHAPPVVFAWRYGATLLHGAVLAHAARGAEKNNIGNRREMGTGRDTERSAVLPVRVMSVVRLDGALREFTALNRHDRTQRPLMFCLSDAEHVTLSAEESDPEEEGEEGNDGRSSPEVFDAESIDLLARLHYKRRCGGVGLSVNEDAFQRKVHTYAIKEEGEARERYHFGNRTIKKEETKEEEEEETLVSFAMGYGHFLITTTRAVYAFCHFAALPFPQRAAQWKQSLVFAQRLPAVRKDNRNNTMHNNTTSSRGDKDDLKNMIHLEHETLTRDGWVVGMHNAGSAQRFHIFSKSFLYDLYLGSRRSEQYITQLLDALSPVQSIAVVGHSDDAFLSPSRHTTPCARRKATDAHHSEYGQEGKSRRKKQLGGREAVDCGISCMPSDFPVTSSPTRATASSHCAAANAIRLERFIASHGTHIVPLPGIGLLGGFAEPGTCDTHLSTADALCEMALHVAAATRQKRKRNERLAAVRRIYAARLFSAERYLESAAQYGMISPDASGPPFLNALIVAFAGVALDDVEPLLLLLLLRLRGYEQHARGFGGNSVEVSCLVTALVSVLLKQCSELNKGHRVDCERAGHKCEHGRDADERVDPYVDMRAFLRQKYELRSPRRLLDSVLARCQSFVEWTAIRRAVFGIAEAKETVALCTAQGRHGEVLSYLFRERDRPLEALVYMEQLINQRSQSRVHAGKRYASHRVHDSEMRSYMLLYASLLMRRFPCRFVRRGLIALDDKSNDGGVVRVMDFVDFIPALLLYDPRHNETAMEADGDAGLVLQRETVEESLLDAERARAPYHAAQLYLDHALEMEGYAEDALASLLLFFIARDSDDATLSRFFRKHCTSGDPSWCRGIHNVVEMTYAYRLCWRFQRPTGCAWVYFAVGRYTEAVRLAMSLGDEALAMEFIRRIRVTPTAEVDTGTIRRALWKELAATTAVNRGGGSRRALQLIAESEGELNVSDVLPHLCTDVMMMEFREELLASVASFGHTLAELRQAIDASAQDAEVLRHDATAVRQRPLWLHKSQRCAACGHPALTRPFVAFRGCRHVLHKTCFDTRRAAVEAERLKGKETAVGESGDEVKCVVCSTRYLRVMLEAPLARGIQGDIPRLP